ncbi:MAG: hypothetical protein JSS09_02430, partial [Verrucomicrobia bacterium]|nr:hypothetical protein [Verrucomicrobiota bacterium]
GDDYTKEEKLKLPLIKILKQYKTSLLLIILASGFSHVTYTLSFTFMNGFIPLITSFSKTKVMLLNTNLLALDMILLPLFGYLAHKLGKEKIMLTGSLCAVFLAIPLFALLPNSSIYDVTFVRTSLIIFGIAFAAPYYAWAIELVPSKHRYLILALGSSLGSQLIGAPSSAICLWLYKITKLTLVPGLYLMASGLFASLALYYSLKTQKRKTLLKTS